MGRVNYGRFQSLINDTRSSITDEELFCSQAMARHFEKIARAQTRRYGYKRRISVLPFWAPELKFAAATNDNDIHINCGCEVITRKTSRIDRYRAVYGMFAHELGHGLNKDVPKQQVMNLLNMLLMAVLAWLCVRTVGMHTAFGFESVNYGFAYILLGCAWLSMLSPLTGLLTSAYSRHAEYRADRQAVSEGYGEALITGLKKLAKSNFSHLAPSPLLVKLTYSHPPLSQRIAAIEAALSSREQESAGVGE